MKVSPAVAVIGVALVAVVGVASWQSRSRQAPGAGAARPVVAPDRPAGPAPFAPPADSAMPAGPFGDAVRRGRQIFEQTGVYANKYTGNALTCANCHLDAGRLANSAPLWAAFVSYPAYRNKNKHVNTLQERMQGCFLYSMNGRAPPLGDPVLVALESYAYWLATGAPVNAAIAGRGYPKVSPPPLPPDDARGAAVYAERCALCHGTGGEGRRAAGTQVFPPLWGPRSFNWGAGMADVDNAAGFIKANMPFGLGGTLSDQDAWDVAAFVNGHERPQDPRYTGSVAKTRALYHDSPMSRYGTRVGGAVLGARSVAPGVRAGGAGRSTR